MENGSISKRLENYCPQYYNKRKSRRRKRLSLLLLSIYFFHHRVNGYYNVNFELRNPLLVAYRGYTASFVRNNTLYFYGGDGGRRTNADFSEPIPCFESLHFDPDNGSIIYTTVPDNSIPKYDNFSAYARAVLLPDNERALIFGGMRSLDLTVMGNISAPMYLDQYDFRTRLWTSLPAKLSETAPQVAMLRNRVFHSATLAANGKIYIAGGESVGYINDAIDLWEYDPEASVFSPIQNAQIFSPYQITHPNQCAVALPDGRILYIMDISNYIRILDTNTNRMYDQEVQGYDNIDGGGSRPLNSSVSDYPNIRQNVSPILAPNPRYIYVFGGVMRFDHIYQEVANDLVILDVETWTWSLPTDIYGIPPTPRTNPTIGILNDSYMVVTHGHSTTMKMSNEFNVLQLPNTFSIPAGPVTWVTNITDDALLNTVDDDYISAQALGVKSSALSHDLSVGAIVGVVIGCCLGITILACCIMCGCYKRRHLKLILRAMIRYFIWDPRVGEPKWTETCHLITKIILCCLFAAYVAYMVQLVAKSPVATISLVSPVDQIPFPDMRLCFEGFRNLTYFSFETDTMTPQTFLDSGYIRQLNTTGLAILDESNHYMMNGSLSCWLISGPEDDFFITRPVANNGGSFRFLYTGEPEDRGETTIYLELYRHGANPNMAVYEHIPQPYLSQQTLDNWMRLEFNEMKSNQLFNYYKIPYHTQAWVGFQMIDNRNLEDTLWNVVGFAPIYTYEPSLITTYQSNTPNNISMPAGAIDIYPSSMAYLTMQDQQIYTIMTVLGPAAGLLGLLITLDRVLFGARSISPWGLVHRWSFGKLKASLRKHLHEAFGFLHRPIPFVHPINQQFFNHQATLAHHGLSSISEEKDINSSYGNEKHIHRGHDTMALEKNNNIMTSSASTIIDDSPTKQQSYEQRMHMLESQLVKQGNLLFTQQQQILEQQRRLQMMELVNKAYYTDPEVFYNLNDAYCQNSTPSVEHEKSIQFKDMLWREKTNDPYPHRIHSSRVDSIKADYRDDTSRKTASISSEKDLLI